MTQWSCYCIGESVCYWLEKGNSMDTWRRRTHNTWRWRSTLIKSERCYWMTASLYRKYNTFSDRDSEQQHRRMTFGELPNHPFLLTMVTLHIVNWTICTVLPKYKGVKKPRSAKTQENNNLSIKLPKIKTECAWNGFYYQGAYLLIWQIYYQYLSKAYQQKYYSTNKWKILTFD